MLECPVTAMAAISSEMMGHTASTADDAAWDHLVSAATRCWGTSLIPTQMVMRTEIKTFARYSPFYGSVAEWCWNLIKVEFLIQLLNTVANININRQTFLAISGTRLKVLRHLAAGYVGRQMDSAGS